MKKQFNSSLRAVAGSTMLALLLTACGGGSGSSSSGAPGSTQLGTSTVSGTVTGFGSLIVDGVRIDDRAVVAGIEKEDDSVENAELKIGQHVEVEHNGNLIATAIRITSELEGPVATVDAAAGTLTVLGQTVSVNSDAALGPVTVFETPYTQLADIKTGDSVEIFGLLKIDAAGKTTLQATRIEKRTVAAFNRVKGIVSELSVSASTFKLGALLVNYAGAKVKPSAAALVNGVEVYVSIPVNPTFTALAINAAVVKVKNHKEKNQDMEARLGGLITKLDAGAKTFVVDGITVDATQAVFAQPGKGFADLKEGTYVRVHGSYLADGTLKAKTIVLRRVESESGMEVELHGTILNFNSNSDFTVRGIPVDAGSAKFSCNVSAVLSNNLQVEIEGSVTATGKVIATKVSCENVTDGASVVERLGLAGKTDATAKTFTVVGLQETRVQWSATTLFVGVDPAALDGKLVEVEGMMSAGVLQATKIRLAMH